MKQNFITSIIMAASALTLFSCSFESDRDYADANNGKANALVTVKTLETGETYFQVDDSTTFEPVGWTNTFKEEKRALCNLTVLEEKSEKFDKKVSVNWINEILTKKALTTEEAESDNVLGREDPVEIINDFWTVCEDGYLTLHFATHWGNSSISHRVNLVKTEDEADTFRFYHDKNGDFGGTTWSQGIVAFKIADLLPESPDGKKTFKLVWQSFNGEKSIDVKYLKK